MQFTITTNPSLYSDPLPPRARSQPQRTQRPDDPATKIERAALNSRLRGTAADHRWMVASCAMIVGGAFPCRLLTSAERTRHQNITRCAQYPPMSGPRVDTEFAPHGPHGRLSPKRRPLFWVSVAAVWVQHVSRFRPRLVVDWHEKLLQEVGGDAVRLQGLHHVGAVSSHGRHDTPRWHTREIERQAEPSSREVHAEVMRQSLRSTLGRASRTVLASV